MGEQVQENKKVLCWKKLKNTVLRTGERSAEKRESVLLKNGREQSAAEWERMKLASEYQAER